MNDINALRSVLFETLRGLRNKDNPMDLDRAKAINETAQVIINSVKVEADHMKLTGGQGSGFIPIGAKTPVERIAGPKENQTVTKLNAAGSLIHHKLV